MGAEILQNPLPHLAVFPVALHQGNNIAGSHVALLSQTLLSTSFWALLTIKSISKFCGHFDCRGVLWGISPKTQLYGVGITYRQGGLCLEFGNGRRCEGSEPTVGL